MAHRFKSYVLCTPKWPSGYLNGPLKVWIVPKPIKIPLLPREAPNFYSLRVQSHQKLLCDIVGKSRRRRQKETSQHRNLSSRGHIDINHRRTNDIQHKKNETLRAQKNLHATRKMALLWTLKKSKTVCVNILAFEIVYQLFSLFSTLHFCVVKLKVKLVYGMWLCDRFLWKEKKPRSL